MSEPTSSPPEFSTATDFVDAGMNEIAARILAAALELFARKGYTATTVREIVSEADVTNPMLYYYFDSKQGVFIALIEVLYESMAEAIDEIVEREEGLRNQLREVARLHFDACADAPEVLRFVYSVSFGPVESRPEFEVPAAEAVIASRIDNAFREAIDRGKFHPQPGFDSVFLTERFMGQISHHLMGFLGIEDDNYNRGDHPFDNRNTPDDYLGDAAIEQMLDFFFGGAGRLDREAT